MSTPLGCTDIGNKKSEFVEKNSDPLHFVLEYSSGSAFLIFSILSQKKYFSKLQI